MKKITIVFSLCIINANYCMKKQLQLKKTNKSDSQIKFRRKEEREDNQALLQGIKIPNMKSPELCHIIEEN